MAMIGNPIVSTDFPKDTFSGNGSTTAFTMAIAPASVNAVIVVVSGITQDPSTYTISGTTLTFSAAPPTGTDNISVRHLGVAGIPNTPSAASVVTASIADANITQAKLASGVAGNGPAFSSYLGSNQTLSSNTWTKLQINTEEFDTNSNYDSSTNYRFTPTVAGYYQFSCGIAALDGVNTALLSAIYKNGSAVKKATNYGSASALDDWSVSISGIIYMNGSTDYVELYANLVGITLTVNSGSSNTWFSGALVRSA